MDQLDGRGRNAGRAMILGAALLWSTAGAAIKSVSASDDIVRTGLQIAGGRSLVAALLLILLAGSGALALNRTSLLTAIAYAGTVISFALANRLTTAANAIFIQNSGLLFILALGPWLLGEKNRLRDYAAIASLMAGLAILVFLDKAEADKPYKTVGDALAIFSAVTYALVIIGLRANREGNAASPILYGNLFAALVCLPMFLPLQIGAPRDMALVAYLGVFQLGLSYFLFSRGLRRIGAMEGAILAFIEPVLNPIWTALVCGERPGPWALVGCAVIASAVLAHTLAAMRPAESRPGVLSPDP